MTRAELHNVSGFHAASVLAAAAHLQAEMPRPKVPAEPTAIIRNEGYLNGYLDAIKTLKESTAPKPPDVPKKEHQPYGQPAENQNRK